MIELNKTWFPHGVGANNFGWDPVTPEHSRPDIWPRIHLGGDFWPDDGKVFAHPFRTVVSGPVKLIRNDGAGNSILVQTAGDFEIHYYHVREGELSKEIKDALKSDALKSGASIPVGTIIGPCGDVGLGTARHVHLAIKAKPGTDLSALLGDKWNENKLEDFIDKLGPVFKEKAEGRDIEWMNENVICRHVGGKKGPIMLYINPKAVL